MDAGAEEVGFFPYLRILNYPCSMNYLSAENISKSFGEQVLFEGLTFGLARGDKTALIARNGVGKTTLLRILSGKESSDTGEFAVRTGIRTGFLEQARSWTTRLVLKNSFVLQTLRF